MSIDLPSAPAATLASSATRKPSRLWIVEDHESIRELLCDFARGLPAVELIGNSRNAEPMLATAKRDGLDLVILDLLLEGSGGLQVLEQLSAVSPRPKVIVFSGMATLHTVQTAVEWGVTGYVHKSSSLEDLRQAIDRSRGEEPISRVAPVRSSGSLSSDEALKRTALPSRRAIGRSCR